MRGLLGSGASYFVPSLAVPRKKHIITRRGLSLVHGARALKAASCNGSERVLLDARFPFVPCGGALTCAVRSCRSPGCDALLLVDDNDDAIKMCEFYND